MYVCDCVSRFGWEESFFRTLEAARKVELKWLSGFIVAHSANIFQFGFAPIVCSAVTFIVYSSLGNDLEASVVFPSIALFVIMVIPLQLVPMGIGMATELKVGARVVLCPHVGVRS